MPFLVMYGGAAGDGKEGGVTHQQQATEACHHQQKIAMSLLRSGAESIFRITPFTSAVRFYIA